MNPTAMGLYAELCGRTLARAHARSGDRVAIASYLGGKDVFDRAIAEFSELYADQTERDYEALQRATASNTTARITVAGAASDGTAAYFLAAALASRLAVLPIGSRLR